MSRTPAQTYCLVKDSQELRDLIIIKLKQKGTSTYKVARVLHIDVDNLNKWLKGSRTMGQWSILMVAKHLGVMVSLKIDIHE